MNVMNPTDKGRAWKVQNLHLNVYVIMLISMILGKKTLHISTEPYIHTYIHRTMQAYSNKSSYLLTIYSFFYSLKIYLWTSFFFVASCWLSVYFFFFHLRSHFLSFILNFIHFSFFFDLLSVQFLFSSSRVF